MDIFSRFNRKAIDDRQIDTLIGLSKGILADGVVSETEAECLHKWLVQSRQTTSNPIILNLLQKLDSMFADARLDTDEALELLEVLKRISGDPSEFGELAKTTSLPLCRPPPSVSFTSRSFLFTGTCAFGTRRQCQEATESRGGVLAKGVTKTLNYLVLGTYVTDSWAHETFGRKIEKAMKYRESGIPLAIITEKHWADAGKLTV
jgi:NAD-dependent DNA ligase